MQHAVSTRDRTVIHAGAVAPGTHETFLCDWCGADAEHKAGRIRIAHFAHWRGQADPTLCPFVIIGRYLRHRYSYNTFAKEDARGIPLGFYYYFGLKPTVSRNAVRNAYRLQVAGTEGKKRQEIDAVYSALRERMRPEEDEKSEGERVSPPSGEPARSLDARPFSPARTGAASLSPVTRTLPLTAVPMLRAPEGHEATRNATIVAGMVLVAGVLFLLGYAMWPAGMFGPHSLTPAGAAKEEVTPGPFHASPLAAAQAQAPPRGAPAINAVSAPTSLPARPPEPDANTASAQMEPAPRPIPVAHANFRVAVTLSLRHAFVMVHLDDREVWRTIFKGSKDGTRIVVSSDVIVSNSGNRLLKIWVISPDKVAANEYVIFPLALIPGENPDVRIGFDSSRPLTHRLLLPPARAATPSQAREGPTPLGVGAS
jgi:Na+-transporting methylmalonyl-CoA/oxaloacetate decarboxylase gamma subunit